MELLFFCVTLIFSVVSLHFILQREKTELNEKRKKKLQEIVNNKIDSEDIQTAKKQCVELLENVYYEHKDVIIELKASPFKIIMKLLIAAFLISILYTLFEQELLKNFVLIKINNNNIKLTHLLVIIYTIFITIASLYSYAETRHTIRVKHKL